MNSDHLEREPSGAYPPRGTDKTHVGFYAGFAGQLVH